MAFTPDEKRKTIVNIVDMDNLSSSELGDYEFFTCPEARKRTFSPKVFEVLRRQHNQTPPPGDQQVIQDNFFFLDYLGFMADKCYPIDKLTLTGRVETEEYIFELLQISDLHVEYEDDDIQGILGVRDARSKNKDLLKAIRVNIFDGTIFSYRGEIYVADGDGILSYITYKDLHQASGELKYLRTDGEDFAVNDYIAVDTFSSQTLVVYSGESLRRLGNLGDFSKGGKSGQFVKTGEPQLMFEKSLTYDTRKHMGRPFIFCDGRSRVWAFNRDGRLTIFSGEFEVLYMGRYTNADFSSMKYLNGRMGFRLVETFTDN